MVQSTTHPPIAEAVSPDESALKGTQDTIYLVCDLRDERGAHPVYLCLITKDGLLKDEIASVDSRGEVSLSSRETFYTVVGQNAPGVIVVCNNPSGDSLITESKLQIAEQIARIGEEVIGIPLTDLSVVSEQKNSDSEYVVDTQGTLFDLLGVKQPTYQVTIQRISKHLLQPRGSRSGYFRPHNRRYLGNKYRLLGFIEDIISEKCGSISSLCDIFAGTGVVGERFNRSGIKIVSNDFLSANYSCLKAFLGVKTDLREDIARKIEHLNNLPGSSENYFSEHFGGTYFEESNARKIGAIREEIERIADSEDEKHILICSLIYAVDKVANTVGHYDAFRKRLDMVQSLRLLIPDIDYSRNSNNEIYRADANELIRNISCDVLYIDPPYNSRQYSDAYHLLENLAEWKKPKVVGVAKKMDRSHIKSDYCLKGATSAFADLISNADCKHILLSYNNTGDSKDVRSNARMDDSAIMRILRNKGDVEVFEREYKAFTAGKSDTEGNTERIFYCRVTK